MIDRTKPLLDLDALAPRDFVVLKGKRYPLMHIDGFGLRDRARLFALATQIDELEKKGTDATEEETAQYEVLVRDLAAMILPTAPAKHLATVPFGRLVALGTAFFVWAQQTSLLPRALMQMMPTSARTSPASRASIRRSPSTRRSAS